MGKQGRGSISNYIQHYDALQKIGVWDYLTALEQDNFNLEQFFSEALEMFNIQTAGGLIEFVISRFLDRFLPEHLLFVIEDRINPEPETYYFRRLKSDCPVASVDWYRRFKEFCPQNAPPYILGAEGCRLPEDLLHAMREYEPSVILPMRGIEGVYGFVVFSNKVVGGGYTDREIDYLVRLIRFFSVGLQNTLNHHSSITDLKTGLFNHSYFVKRLEEELFRGRRYKTPTSLILMDVDFFKTLNDTYGHLAGDIILREIARVMKNKLRVEDVLSRFGGEEFTLLLPATPPSTALEIAERLRTAIANTETVYEKDKLKITMSLGCCTSTPLEHLSPTEILKRADLALYKSKAEGRNCTSFYS